MLQNASLLAIVAVDTEENEPIKNEVWWVRHHFWGPRCCALSGIGFLGFALTCAGSLPFPASAQLPLMYFFSTFGSLWANATTPLYYELAVEATYPIAEGLTTAALTLLNNVGVFLFLLVTQLFPNIGTGWMNWCVVGAAAAAIALVIPLKEEQRRIMVDASEGAVSSQPEVQHLH